MRRSPCAESTRSLACTISGLRRKAISRTSWSVGDPCAVARAAPAAPATSRQATHLALSLTRVLSRGSERHSGELDAPRSPDPSVRRPHDQDCADDGIRTARGRECEKGRSRAVRPKGWSREQAATRDEPQLVLFAGARGRQIVHHDVPPLGVLIVKDEEPALVPVAPDGLLEHTFGADDRRKRIFDGAELPLARGQRPG